MEEKDRSLNVKNDRHRYKYSSIDDEIKIEGCFKLDELRQVIDYVEAFKKSFNDEDTEPFAGHKRFMNNIHND